jgi:tetratricopeptide (TPR) repeat protein
VLRLLLLLFLPFSLFALELSFQSGKENYDKYTILHVKANSPFICEAQTDDFKNITKVICAFSKKPDQTLKPVGDDFFDVKSEIKKDTFFLLITPHHKVKLLSDIFDLPNERNLYQPKVQLSKAWVLIGYKEKLPLLNSKKKSAKSLNLPILFPKRGMLYVGSLDIQGNPVHIQEARDVSSYLKAKKSFDDKNYDGTIREIDDVIKGHPDSIFMSELMYYKMRALAELKKYDEMIPLSKTYLRKYSSDENVPEVLSLTALAYSKIGQNSDADYFFDRLFSEHGETVYAKKGMIYKGDQLQLSGDNKKSVEYFQKAMDETNDIDTAATAAHRLANYYLKTATPKNARDYIDKIIQADPQYFLKDKEDSLKLSLALAEKRMYYEASKISQIVLATMKKLDENYEATLKNSGVWLAKTDQKNDANTLLSRYQKEFPEGSFADEVKTVKDSLYFDVNTTNPSAAMANYDNLIKNYKNDPIGQKALYKKAQTLLKLQKYEALLNLKGSLQQLDKKVYPDAQSMVNQSAMQLAKAKLKAGLCSEVMSISNDYGVKLPKEFDDEMYNCYMKIPQLNMAKGLAGSNINAKTITEKIKWMYRYANVLFQTGDYKNTIKVGNDVLTLIGKEKTSPYFDLYRTMFDAYQRTANSNKMLEMMTKIILTFGESYKDIERYVQMVDLGTRMKDDNIIITYGNRVMELQRKTGSYTQTPYVEFTTYQAYMNKNDLTRSIDIISSLDKRNLSKEQRARQKYLLGALLQKKGRNNEAAVEFKKAIAAQKDSAWAKLAQDALKL